MTSTPTATNPTLRQGDSGAAVTELQQLLNAKGINIAVDEIFDDATRAAVVQFQKEKGINIAVDEIFGDATRAAVVQFQKESGIATDGIVGPQTWQALRRGGNAPIQLTDAAIQYKPSNSPYQKEAFEWLQSQISSSVLGEFARRWRNLR